MEVDVNVDVGESVGVSVGLVVDDASISVGDRLLVVDEASIVEIGILFTGVDGTIEM